jgi:ribosomal protein S18 acetylase RimI-like enzyme
MNIHQLEDGAQNRAALQDLFNATPNYYLSISGKLAAPDEAENEFVELPPNFPRADQFIFGFYIADELIGAAGMLRGFRTANQVMLGLLLIAEKHQGHGHGSHAYGELEKIMTTWPGIDTVRIGVIETNIEAFGFWHKMGFAENGERKPKYSPYIADIIVMVKVLGTKK